MPRGVTEDDVFQAADTLLARGERPTIERVRQELGSGSPNTVNPHLDAWWKVLGHRVGGLQAPGVPPAVLQAAVRFYQEIRSQALGEAQAVIAEHHRQSQEAQKALDAGQAAMASEKTALQATIETLRGELARVTEANQMLTRQSAQHQAEVANARSQLAQAMLQLQRAQEEHNGAAASGRAELDRIREQWQGNETRFLGEIDHLRDEIKRQRGEYDRVQRGFQGRIQDLEQQLSAGAKERAALRVALDSTQRDLASEREKRSFAEGALTARRERTPAMPPRRRKIRDAK